MLQQTRHSWFTVIHTAVTAYLYLPGPVLCSSPGSRAACCCHIHKQSGCHWPWGHAGPCCCCCPHACPCTSPAPAPAVGAACGPHTTRDTWGLGHGIWVSNAACLLSAAAAAVATCSSSHTQPQQRAHPAAPASACETHSLQCVCTQHSSPTSQPAASPGSSASPSACGPHVQP